MSTPLIVFGVGGHGRVVIDIALASGETVSTVVDDERPLESLFGIPAVKASDQFFKSLERFRFVVAVGSNLARQRVFENLLAFGGEPVRLIHPFSCVSPRAQIGRGTVVCAGAVIGAGSTIGENCIINTSASVDHDCVIGEHVHICPGVRLAGEVTVGVRSMLGLGTVVLPRISIGNDSVLGAGSVVNRPLAANAVAWGVPARVRHENRVAERSSSST